MDVTWHHVALAVKDMEKALWFYRDLLGLEVDWERERYTGEGFGKVVGLPGAAARVVMLKGGGGLGLELFQYITPAGEGSAEKRMCDFGLTHFALSVKGIQKIYERLLREGIRFNCPPQNLRPGVWATYMKDPEGVTIELVEYE